MNTENDVEIEDISETQSNDKIKTLNEQNDESEDSKNVNIVLDSNTMTEELIQELDTSYRILTDIIKQNKSTCYPFMDKVDIKGLGLWDYEAKVKEPMWLNKIIEKFESQQYNGITEFARDFRTMVENCYRYNGTEHIISKRAKRIEMIFEGKLALLKKELRDKASLAITSKGKFSIDMNDDTLAPVSRYGRIGNTREYASIHDDTTAKLVYDFVRCEETVLAEDEKKASHRERRQQEILYQRIAAAWITTIEEQEDVKFIRTSHSLPEIGFFLHLGESVLKFPELNMYLLERCILIPENSLYLAKIMTSLLCTYQERSQLNQRPPMHYSTWNKRLLERLVKWFEVAQKQNSYLIASERLGISLEFFESLEWKNQLFSPDKTILFSELKFQQRVQIIKALCDSSALLQSIQNTLLQMDAPQLQCMQLGKDYLGNIYIYFPQFCGDDVRVYRHREFGEPIPKIVPDEVWVAPKPPTPITEIESVLVGNGICNGNIAATKENSCNEPPVEKSKEPIESTQVSEEKFSLVDAESNSCIKECDKTENVTLVKKENVLEIVEEINSDKMEKSEVSEEIMNTDATINIDKSLPHSIPVANDASEDLAVKPKKLTDVGDESSSIGNNSCEESNTVSKVRDVRDGVDNEKDSTEVDEKLKLTASQSTKIENSNNENIVANETKDFDNFEKRTSRSRRKNPKYSDDSSPIPERRSLRKRTSTVAKCEPETKPATPKKKQKVSKQQQSAKKQKQQSPKKEKKEPPIRHGNIDFEMLCDNVDAIQLLINDLEAQQTDEKRIEYGKAAFVTHKELIEKLRWLYEELEPWNVKLQKARLQAQIQMKREHDQIQNLSRKFDPWSEELTSKNTYAYGDNLTISHVGVDSPMSSVASYDGGSGDEEYSHSYFTRKPSASPPPRIFDESLFEVERETLLTAALSELEEVLKENLQDLLKIADRAQLQDNSSTNDGRRTRQKIKQQNKVLGKVLTFAEEKVENFPSLLPILIPDSDVYDVVDMILLQEETRLQEIAEEQRRKRLERAMKARPKAINKITRPIINEPMEQARKHSYEKMKTSVPRSGPKPVVPSALPCNISIQMQNGKIYAATRLNDGRVVPIERKNNASVASSVDDLFAKTKSAVEKKIATYTVPHISLKGAKSPEKPKISRRIPQQISRNSPSQISILTSKLVPKSPLQRAQIGSGSPTIPLPPEKLQTLMQTPQKIPNTGTSPAKITSNVVGKQSPRKIVVTQPLRRTIIGSSPQLQQTGINYPLPMKTSLNKINTVPTIEKRQSNHPVTLMQQKQVSTVQLQNQFQPVKTSLDQKSPASHVVQTVQRPIILNGARYNVVNSPQQTLTIAQQPQFYSTGNGQTIFLTQPTRFGHPILTPVQIISPAIKLQTTASAVTGNTQGNMVLIPIQNSGTTQVAQARITTPSTQGINVVASSPQKQNEQGTP